MEGIGRQVGKFRVLAARFVFLVLSCSYPRVLVSGDSHVMRPCSCEVVPSQHTVEISTFCSQSYHPVVGQDGPRVGVLTYGALRIA